jgi:hypothetical protein
MDGEAEQPMTAAEVDNIHDGVGEFFIIKKSKY